MSHASCSFAQQEAFIRRLGVGTTPSGLAEDGGMVEIVIVGKQRQGKTILPASFAMAGSGVAAMAGENGLDVALEGGGFA